MVSVIVLNGTSSAGKTSIARELQWLLDGTFLTLGIDTLIAALPSLGPRGARNIEIASDGRVLLGPEFGAIEAAWQAGLAAMAHAGARVILDDVFLSGAASQERLRRALSGLDVLWVAIDCPLDVARDREVARGDRMLGLAAHQHPVVHVGVDYDLRVDTATATPYECAQIITAEVARRTG